MSLEYKRVIAIDLGSNNIRFLEMNCQTKEFTKKIQIMVKTADGLSKTGLIHNNAQKRVIKAINDAQKEIDFSNAKIKAVATEAIRQSRNSQEVLNVIKEKTGVIFEILEGTDEAKYALSATKNRLQLLCKPLERFILVDMGGGSTEVIFNHNNKTISRSFKIGVVTISQLYNYSDLKRKLPQIMEEVSAFIQEVTSGLGGYQLIMTGGTPSTIAAMKIGLTYNTYTPECINGLEVKIEDLDFCFLKLLEMSFDEKEVVVGVGKAELIVAGILILKQLLQYINSKSFIVIADGVSEGIALKCCF